MMSLTKVSLWEVVKKQLRFKLKSYRGMFTSLMILQIIGILFSLAGEGGGGGSSSNGFSYDMTYYSSNIMFALIMIWAFISAIIITTRAYRFDDYAFVANRLTSHVCEYPFPGPGKYNRGNHILAGESVNQTCDPVHSGQ